MVTPDILLASNSPRRRVMMTWTGWTFSVKPADIDESMLPGESPVEYVLRLAESKARAMRSAAREGEIILSADTTVADEQGLLGKPADPKEAAAMLRRLRGRSHQVHTALAVYDPFSGRMELDRCTSQVPMRNYSDQELDDYVASGDPMDKAGAYAIQHAQFHPVENFKGCFASVMGLPLCHLERTLKKIGTDSLTDIPRACQNNLGYVCPIHAAVRGGEDVG